MIYGLDLSEPSLLLTQEDIQTSITHHQRVSIHADDPDRTSAGDF
jgi:hypothetical protein